MGDLGGLFFFFFFRGIRQFYFEITIVVEFQSDGSVTGEISILFNLYKQYSC